MPRNRMLNRCMLGRVRVVEWDTDAAEALEWVLVEDVAGAAAEAGATVAAILRVWPPMQDLTWTR